MGNAPHRMQATYAADKQLANSIGKSDSQGDKNGIAKLSS